MSNHLGRRSYLALFLAVVTTVVLTAGQRTRPTPVSFQVAETTIGDIQRAFKADNLTAHQMTQLYLDSIEAFDKNGPKINSIITLNPNALADADKLDAQYRQSGPVGPLHGIPILVKDEIDTAGMPTTLG